MGTDKLLNKIYFGIFANAQVSAEPARTSSPDPVGLPNTASLLLMMSLLSCSLIFSIDVQAANPTEDQIQSQSILTHEESTANTAESTRRDFHSHLSQNARTLGPGKWSYQPYPASSSANSFFANSISVGIGQRFEIGTVPVYWMSNSPDRLTQNANFKYNFYRSEQHGFSLAYSVLYFKYKFLLSYGIPSEIHTEDKMQDFGFLYTYHYSPDVSLSFNYFIHHFSAKFDPGIGVTDEVNENLQPDIMIDVETRLSPRFFITAGVALAPLDGSNTLISVTNYWGAGATITWVRPAKFFSAPSLGAHYVPENQKTRIMLSSSFY